MLWHTTTYRLPPEAKPGQCQRTVSEKNPAPCPEKATCGFTSILVGQGDRRYTERCDACTIAMAERIGIKPPGLREALIFPIPKAPATISLSRCQSCLAPVYWIYTHRGSRMPADPNGVSHFLTCPGASAHRRKS